MMILHKKKKFHNSFFIDFFLNYLNDWKKYALIYQKKCEKFNKFKYIIILIYKNIKK